jgi:hypothetical protein
VLLIHLRQQNPCRQSVARPGTLEPKYHGWVCTSLWCCSVWQAPPHQRAGPSREDTSVRVEQKADTSEHDIGGCKQVTERRLPVHGDVTSHGDPAVHQMLRRLHVRKVFMTTGRAGE